MKLLVKKKSTIAILVFLIAFTFNLSAQEKRPLFIGLQPSVTVEQFYDENELDINAIPLLVQVPVAKRLDFRAVTIFNYHIGGEENGFSDIGVQFLLPVFIKKKETTKSVSKGFYIAPVVGIGRNLINDHNTLTLALEPGFQFPANKNFSVALGVQLGATYFDYDNQPNVWRNHFGFKVNIGFWVNKDK